VCECEGEFGPSFGVADFLSHHHILSELLSELHKLANRLSAPGARAFLRPFDALLIPQFHAAYFRSNEGGCAIAGVITMFTQHTNSGSVSEVRL
jgi:hypothetical protein